MSSFESNYPVQQVFGAHVGPRWLSRVAPIRVVAAADFAPATKQATLPYLGSAAVLFRPASSSRTLTPPPLGRPVPDETKVSLELCIGHIRDLSRMKSKCHSSSLTGRIRDQNEDPLLCVPRFGVVCRYRIY